jgi:hypothetical protein
MSLFRGACSNWPTTSLNPGPRNAPHAPPQPNSNFTPTLRLPPSLPCSSPLPQISDPKISQISAFGVLLHPMSWLELSCLAPAKIAIVAMRWWMNLKADSDHLRKGGDTLLRLLLSRLTLARFGSLLGAKRITKHSHTSIRTRIFSRKLGLGAQRGLVRRVLRRFLSEHEN